jgi:transcriptional regulator with XRE-family HTH domain
MEEFKSQKIKSALKSLLKKKGITYDELAEELECSVPTVKRILGPEEITLNRLFQICDFLDISISELEASSASTETERFEFSEEQQEFFVKNKNYFSYLMALVSGETPKQIADRCGLNQRSTDKYLIGLEKIGLIHVTGKQKVRPIFKMSPHLGKGKLAKAYFETLIQNAASFMINNIHEYMIDPNKSRPGSKFGIMVVKATPESYLEWIKESSAALTNFEKKARFEEKVRSASELKTVVITDGAALVPHDYHGLKTIENAMGEIVNF